MGSSAIVPTEKKVFGLLVVLALLSITAIPSEYTGDGPEYFGMTISFCEHASFNLTERDIELRSKATGEPLQKDGYFPDARGYYYSYHFWMYSLLCSPGYLLLSLLQADVVRVSVVTNTILLLLLGWWVLFKVNRPLRHRHCLLCVAYINPVLLYVPWSHPEVYVYVCFLLGLIEFTEKRYLAAVAFMCFVSLQATPLFVVPVTVAVYLIVKKKVPPVDYWRLAAVTTIGLVPMAFYRLHFESWNLLVTTGMVSTDFMSVEKVLSLLFDPNFGLVIYYPVLFSTLILQVIRKEKQAICGLAILLLIIVLMTSQGNWNPGMMYIHRYCIWIVPIVIAVVSSQIVRFEKWRLALFLAGYIMTTGAYTAWAANEYRTDNYLRLLPPTKWLLRHAPLVYNPPFEVFVERTVGKEVFWEDSQLLPDIGREAAIYPEVLFREVLPVMVYDQYGIRKAVIRNSKGEMEYVSGGIQWHTGELYCFGKEEEDRTWISLRDAPNGTISFGSGWHDVEHDKAGNQWRRMENEAKLAVLMTGAAQAVTIEMQIRGSPRPSYCSIYLNGSKVLEREILGITNLAFRGNVGAGINILRIIARPAGSQAKDMETADLRTASLAIIGPVKK